MTTPTTNIVIPYGVTVRSKGTAIPSLVGAHAKQNNGVSLKLPAGPCRIAASWEGAEEMRLVVQNQGEATSRTVATIPGGGGAAHRSHRRTRPQGGLRTASHAHGGRPERREPARHRGQGLPRTTSVALAVVA